MLGGVAPAFPRLSFGRCSFSPGSVSPEGGPEVKSRVPMGWPHKGTRNQKVAAFWGHLLVSKKGLFAKKKAKRSKFGSLPFKSWLGVGSPKGGSPKGQKVDMAPKACSPVSRSSGRELTRRLPFLTSILVGEALPSPKKSNSRAPLAGGWSGRPLPNPSA